VRTARMWLLRLAVVGSVVGAFAIPASLSNAAPAPASPVMASPTGPSLTSIQKQIRDRSAALEKIVEQYDGVNTTLAKNQATSAALQKQMGPTLAQLDKARQQVVSIAAEAYMDAGSMSTMNAFINSSSTQDLAANMAMLHQVASTQRDQIVTYQKLTATYSVQKTKLDALIAAENAQKASLAKQKATINTQLAALYKLRTAAYGRAQEASTAGSHPAAPYLPGRGGKVVAFAYAQLGKPYVWAADGPGSYDCSGLVMAAYRSVGVSLPHNAAMQYHSVSHISRSSLSPGDLVFYSNLGHVAIYIGNSKVIHAPQPGEDVKIASVDMMTPYGYGRP
jgi:peptidoglycan DL-endopeptidase CwlO